MWIFRLQIKVTSISSFMKQLQKRFNMAANAFDDLHTFEFNPKEAIVSHSGFKNPKKAKQTEDEIADVNIACDFIQKNDLDDFLCPEDIMVDHLSRVFFCLIMNYCKKHGFPISLPPTRAHDKLIGKQNALIIVKLQLL